jgi:Na+/H+ antiporter NhaD/arsenite permease-like protein
MHSFTMINLIGAALFVLAVLHTFSTKFFEHLAHQSKNHARMWHLLGEVEIVFGVWAMVLVAIMFVLHGQSVTVSYLDGLDFTEPLFVFVIMVISASKPILDLCSYIVTRLSNISESHLLSVQFFITLSLIPLLGSFITEPAAMTLAALLLKKNFYERSISKPMMYATLGVLFVNISIGGTLTPYAAPPILMVAAKWNFDFIFMLKTFGWRSVIAVFINSMVLTFFFRKELYEINTQQLPSEKHSSSSIVTYIHLLFLCGVVIFAHYPVLFVGLFLLFVGFTDAYNQYQSRLMIRESLLVAFFLAGLVVLGGQQKWWLQPLLLTLDPDTVYYGATILTAVTDNAALTYLGSLVDGLSSEFKYALVAGAVTGGGLTVIANAPNPAGYSILRSHFDEGSISPLLLLLYALPPTCVAIFCFQFI